MECQRQKRKSRIVLLKTAYLSLVVVVVVFIAKSRHSLRSLPHATSLPSPAQVAASLGVKGDVHPSSVFRQATPVRFSTPHLMTVTQWGHLGDRLFQYAALLALSRYHGYAAVLREDDFLATSFELPDLDILQQFGNRALAELCPYGVYCSSYLNLTHKKNWTLVGYFQSWRYFRNESELIRRNFRFTRKVRAAVSTTLASLNFSGKVKVGVHIEEGYQLYEHKANSSSSTPDLEYLHRAMDFFRSRFKDVVFLVSSYDIPGCEANMRARNDAICLTGSSGHDLAVLAGCDHCVMTSGAFGWWAAWLAGGRTVYRLPGPYLEKEFSSRDYYPPDWIPMR